MNLEAVATELALALGTVVAADGPTINANPYFETDASNWSAVGGTVARSTAQFHEGVASLLLTPDGVTAAVDARSELVPVTAGQQYEASAWVRCAVARTVRVGINWYTAASGFISGSIPAVAVPANTWTLLTGTATAPPTATQARLIAGSMGSTPLTSHLVHIDEARLRGPTAWLRVPPWGAERISPPAAIVALPERIDYDATYGRGSDHYPDVAVIVLVGKPNDRASRKQVAAYADGSGPKSVKAAVEAHTYTSCDSVRVAWAEFDPVKYAGTDYLAAIFHLDIVGKGA